MPVYRLNVYTTRLARLTAQETLTQLDVSTFPHWAEKDKPEAGNNARREYRAVLNAKVHGSQEGYDARGVRVLTGPGLGAQLRALFAQAEIDAA